MSNLSHFSFNGRITELIIFDCRTYDLTGAVSPFETFAPVLEKYRKLSAQLNQYRPVPVFIHVLFAVMHPKSVPEEFTDFNSHLRLLSVNSIEPNAFIPNSWTQDMMHVLVRKKKSVVLLDKGLISESLKSVLVKSFPRKEFQLKDFSALPAGGNFIRVSHKFKDVGIEGPELIRPVIYPPQGQRTRLDIPIEQYFRLEWPPKVMACIEVLKRVAFHIDQYFTPVVFFKHRHLFLVPDLKQAKIVSALAGQDCLGMINRLVRSIPSLLKKNNCPLNLDVVKVPLYVLKYDSEAYGLCYNNCLSENYEENGRRSSRVYFPDFRTPTIAFLNRYAEKGNLLNDDKVVEASVTGNLLEIASQLDIEHEFTDQLFLEQAIELSERIIHKTEHQIRESLHRKGVRHVQFIDFDFLNMAFHLGSLHCRVKVIERDALL